MVFEKEYTDNPALSRCPIGNSERKNLWNMPVYAHFLNEVDPYEASHYFRSLSKAYNGEVTYWTVPSPEPLLPDEVWASFKSELINEKLNRAACRLAQIIYDWEPDCDKLVFAAILRAGVPLADWLCQLLPGAKSVALSLFVGLGVDQIALRNLKTTYPDRRIIFVDGWTGKGGVAREISRFTTNPLAVLIDPWGCATFAGGYEDILCPSACFTGPVTMGFSRTFYRNPDDLFSAYLFPEKYLRTDIVAAWQNACPRRGQDVLPYPRNVSTPFIKNTELRFHSNEVCRALINANPETIYFSHDQKYVKEHYYLLLALAEHRSVSVTYNAKFLSELKATVACTLKMEYRKS